MMTQEQYDADKRAAALRVEAFKLARDLVLAWARAGTNQTTGAAEAAWKITDQFMAEARKREPK